MQNINYLLSPRKVSAAAIFILLVLISSGIRAQERTVGVIEHYRPNTEGYVLFGPIGDTNTYLIDKCGKKVHQWSSSYSPGLSVYLLEDGSILRAGKVNGRDFVAGGYGGIIERFDWDGKKVWSYKIANDTHWSHHDFKFMPNGNILVIAWDSRHRKEVIENGIDTVNGLKSDQTSVWGETILELQPVGADSAIVVWQWSTWDHIVQDYDPSKINYGTVSDHPELININYAAKPGIPDWLHFNAVDYNPVLDQIVLSSYGFNEFWVIDHSTTTAEAASHSGGKSGKGGDLLYRWGNPAAYNRGVTSDQTLFRQHNVQWIPDGYVNEGKFIVFNNGLGRPGGELYSSVDIINPPLNSNGTYNIESNKPFDPVNPFWQYTAPVPTDFYSSIISGMQAMPNGSVLACLGTTGTFWEIDSNRNRVWKYVNPISGDVPLTQGASVTNSVNSYVFRCRLYPADYAGFNGRVLAGGEEIELNPIRPSLCETQPFETSVAADEEYCTGSNITAKFTLNTMFQPTNTFYLQLSDPFGKFTAPRILDSIKTQQNVDFVTPLPMDLPAGSRYRIRVVATDPPFIGSDGGKDITINAAPKLVFNRPSPYKVCRFKDPVTVTVSGATSYEWRDGGTSPSRIIYKPGWYYVTGTDASTSCQRTDSIEVVNVPYLATYITSSKEEPTLCEGETVTLTSSGGGTYFLWSTGDTTKSIVVSKEGWYKVAATEASGCSGADSVYVSVKPVPTITMTPTGTHEMCQGSSVTLTSSLAKGNKWSTGDTTKTIKVWVSGKYFVTTTNANKCTVSSDVLDVTILSAPEKPVIIQNGNDLSTLAPPPLQWYFNGSIIQGETGQTITGNPDGRYMIIARGSNNCTAMSDVFTLTTASVEEPENVVGITVAPNPFTDKLTIKIANEVRSQYVIEWYNILGERIAKIYEGMLDAGTNQLQYFPSREDGGIYFIRIQTAGTVRTFKVIGE